MHGTPSDVAEECNAHLHLADDYGDGTCTIRCQLSPGHEGLHREVCRNGTVTITWETDAREKCDHGCGRWEHEHRSRGGEPGATDCPRDAEDHNMSTCPLCNPGDELRPCPKSCGTMIFSSFHYGCPVDMAEFAARGSDDDDIYGASDEDPPLGSK